MVNYGMTRLNDGDFYYKLSLTWVSLDDSMSLQKYYRFKLINNYRKIFLGRCEFRQLENQQLEGIIVPRCIYTKTYFYSTTAAVKTA